MEILHAATAGTLESSDVQITVLPSGELDVTIEIRVIDMGALDCTLEARLETALHRAADKLVPEKWGK